jgi:hypothetical protein
VRWPSNEPVASRNEEFERWPRGKATHRHLPTFLAEAADRGGLPRFVVKDFTRYLECGVLAQGFARLACKSCRDEVLVPFSCKTRVDAPVRDILRAEGLEKRVGNFGRGTSVGEAIDEFRQETGPGGRAA